MSRRVLVVYASRFGSTAGVAQAVAERMRDAGLDAEVFSADEAPSPDGYDAVVVGSAIYTARWMPEAFEYVERNREAINDVPAAFFQVCLSILHAGAAKQRIIDAWMEPAKRLAPPVAAATFPGALDRSKLNRGERLMVWMAGIEDGDYRDWEAVTSWADALAKTFAEGEGAVRNLFPG